MSYIEYNDRILIYNIKIKLYMKKKYVHNINIENNCM